MEPRAWARACGAARSLYAARVRIARARPSSTERLDGWAVEQWPAAQSLFLDLRAAADLPRLPGRVSGGTNPAASALLAQPWVLPALRCLHVIGHGEHEAEHEARAAAGADADVMSRHSRAADRAWNRRHNAAHAAAAALALLLGNMALPALRALSLDVPVLRPLPAALAGLQHLVLSVDAGRIRPDIGCEGVLLDAIAGSLPALRTLYVRATSFCFMGGRRGTDLTPCAHLRALALVNIQVVEALWVPDDCRVAVALPADAVGDLYKLLPDQDELFAGDGLCDSVNAVDVRSFRDVDAALAQAAAGEPLCSLDFARLSVLVELRTVLDAASLPAGAAGAALVLDLYRSSDLALLQVDIPCALRLFLSRMQGLRTVALVAHALAELDWATWHGDTRISDVSKRAAIYARFATAPPDKAQRELRELLAQSEHEAAFGAVAGAGGAWQAAAPAGFRPCDMRACTCAACPECAWGAHRGDSRACRCRACVDCLGRAGVPLAAPQAWRREGFDRLRAPLCA